MGSACPGALCGPTAGCAPRPRPLPLPRPCTEDMILFTNDLYVMRIKSISLLRKLKLYKHLGMERLA